MSRYDPGTVYQCSRHLLRLYRSGDFLFCPLQRRHGDQPKGQAIICPRCQMVSFNPGDIREGYCGNCRDWTAPGGKDA